MKAIFENQKKTPIVVFSSLRLCALSENNLDYSAVFALVFAIDSYPALTSLVRWQNKTSIDRRLMLIDSQQLFLKEIPEEKWKLWHFTFYCKVDTQKIQNLILIFFLICVIQRFSPPLLVFLLHCSFSDICPLCRHKTGWESCWTTAHVKLTWTKILHGSFMGICDGRIELQSCLWKLHSSHLFFKRWTGNFMLKLAFLRFTTSTNTSAQRRRTSTAIICRSLNTFGALPGKENFWYGGLWCQNSFHTLSQNIPTLIS